MNSTEIAKNRGWKVGDELCLYDRVYRIVGIHDSDMRPWVEGMLCVEAGHRVPSGRSYSLDLRLPQWESLQDLERVKQGTEAFRKWRAERRRVQEAQWRREHQGEKDNSAATVLDTRATP